MDYPLHYPEESTSTTANTSQSNPYRSYVFNDNSIIFNNSSPTVDNEDGTRSGLVMSRPTQLVLQDPWAQHHHQLLNNNEFNSNDILHHQNLSHSERGIAGFVSKLYQ
ncbi:hypothetical protein BD770DRAFT_104636 [Pilaira anomala]|nr:hypothetical protein BD770DRAFT_104636 [Pilaira anomala]